MRREKTMKKFAEKTVCIILCMAVILLGGCAAGQENGSKPAEEKNTQKVNAVKYTEEPSEIKKTETVYVNADCCGNAQSITVSDWLHTNKGGVMVKDISDLANIENTKGDEIPEKNGKNLVWHMSSTDLYYKGTSNKKLPVELKISYFLDGKSIKPEELAGKSGKVKIDIDIKNNIKTEKTLAGKKVEIYNPVIVAGGFILPENQFSAITVENGRAIGDGSNEIVVIASLPGMYESLGLEKMGIKDGALRLPTHFSITAQAKDFSLGNMYFAALPLSDIGSVFSMPGSVTDIENDISKLTSLAEAVYSLEPEKIISMLKNNEKGIRELADSIGDAVKLYNENKKLISVLKKYMTQENINKLKTLIDDINTTDLKKYAELMSNPLFKSFFRDLPKLAEDLNSVMPLFEALQKDLKDEEVKKSLENLPETLESLNKIIQAVDNNRELTEALSELLSSENTEKINKIIKAVENVDINGMIEEYSLLADNADELIDRFENVLSFGAEYKIYSLCTDKMNTSVSFIFKTPGIKKEDK